MFSSLLKDTSKRKKVLEIKRQKAYVQPKSDRSQHHGQRNHRINSSANSPTCGRVPGAKERVRSKVTKSSRTQFSALAFDPDSDDSDRATLAISKTHHIDSGSATSRRAIRALNASRGTSAVPHQMVHAATIPVLDRSTKYETCFPGLPSDVHVELQYPSWSSRERSVETTSSLKTR